jgi:uncharacterized protein involved in exopolysaccharide biosynthesis
MNSLDQAQPQSSVSRRCRWGVLAILLILAVVVLAIWVLVPPGCEATGALFVEPPLHGGLLKSMDRAVAEQIARITDERCLQEVLQDADVRQTQWFKSRQDAGERLSGLKRRLRVEVVPRTAYIKVSFVAENNQDAPLIVNTLISKYLATLAAQPRTPHEVELSDCERTEKSLQEQLDRVRRDKEAFMASKLGLAGISEEINGAIERYRVLVNEATRLEVEKLRRKAAYEGLLDAESEQITISPEMRLAVQQDPPIARLQELKLSLELEIEAARTAATQPVDPATEGRLKAMTRKLAKLTAAREKEARDYLAETAERQYLNASQAELEVRECMLDAEAQLRDLDCSLQPFHDLEEEQRLLERQLTERRDRINRLRVLIYSSGAIHVQRGAIAHEARESPYELHLALTLAIFGLTVFVVGPIAFLRLARRDRSESAGDPDPDEV